MSIEDPIDTSGVREIFVDGFTNHATKNGVMTCVGYRQYGDTKVIVLRLAWPAVNTSAAIDDAIIAMNSSSDPSNSGGPKNGVH